MDPSTAPTPAPAPAPVQPTDVITDSLLQEARDALPAWVVADTPDGPAVSRSSDAPSDDTTAWVVAEDESTAVPISDLMTRYGTENVLLYLEPEAWDLGAGALVAPDDNENKDPVDPISKPTNTSAPATSTAPVVASMPNGMVSWHDGPIAALIHARTAAAVSVLATEVGQLESKMARIAAVGPAAIAAPPAPDTALGDMLFAAPAASPMNTISAAVLGNPEAQQSLVATWKKAFRPGMTHDELVAAAFPARPTEPMAAVEYWDAAVHEADVWLANQNGTPPPAEGAPETPEPALRTGVEIPAEVPLVDPSQPPAKTAASGMGAPSSGGSSTLTERQHQQRRDAARISADRRRKQREQVRNERAMKVKQRAGNVQSSDFQEAMAVFHQNGVQGSDLTQGNDGYVRGNNSGAHQRLLDSAHQMGYEIHTYKDGSGIAKKGGHVIQLGAPGDGTKWSSDGVRLDPGDPRPTEGRYRTPYEKPKKAKVKKAPAWHSAWGGGKKR